MKIKILGVGSAFTMKSYQSNILIEHNGKNLLIDAGTDIRFSLARQGMSYKDIHALYLTHEHGDHCGGVEYLAFCTYFDPSVQHKIQLFGNSKLLKNMWNHTLSGGLNSIQGKLVNFDDYFDVNMIPENGKFVWEDYIFEIIKIVHIMNEYKPVSTYGLMILTPEGKKIYFTGDIQFIPNQLMSFYRNADYIIHDCETYNFKSGVHAHYDDLIKLNTNIKKKMMLIHVNDNILNVDGFVKKDWINKAKHDGFDCILQKGMSIEL